MVLWIWWTENKRFKGLTPTAWGGKRTGVAFVAMAMAPITRLANRFSFVGSSHVLAGRCHWQTPGAATGADAMVRENAAA